MADGATMTHSLLRRAVAPRPCAAREFEEQTLRGWMAEAAAERARRP